MALYSMVSEKLWQNQYWSNRYVVSAATLAAATTIAGQIRTIEREAHYNVVQFTKYRVSDQVEGTDVYQVINDQVTGDRVPPANVDAMPLFCRVRCLFNTNGGGRPSVKYLLPPLLESEQMGGALTPAAITFYMANYVNLLVPLTGFVDVDGQAFGSGSVAGQVGMRQLRRGSRRRSTPIV